MCRCTGGKQVEVENLVGRRMWLPSSGSGRPSTTGASWWLGPTTLYFSGMVATRDAQCQSSEGRGWRGVWGAKFLQLYKENNIILKINDTTWWRSWHNLYYKMQLYPQCQNVIVWNIYKQFIEMNPGIRGDRQREQDLQICCSQNDV